MTFLKDPRSQEAEYFLAHDMARQSIGEEFGKFCLMLGKYGTTTVRRYCPRTVPNGCRHCDQMESIQGRCKHALEWSRTTMIPVAFSLPSSCKKSSISSKEVVRRSTQGTSTSHGASGTSQAFPCGQSGCNRKYSRRESLYPQRYEKATIPYFEFFCSSPHRDDRIRETQSGLCYCPKVR